jgi:hypothetical protein
MLVIIFTIISAMCVSHGYLGVSQKKLKNNYWAVVTLELLLVIWFMMYFLRGI